MTFFKPTAPQAPVPQQGPTRSGLVERGVRVPMPDRAGEERERVRRIVEEQERIRAAMDRNDQILAEGAVLNPKGRPIGVDNTVTANNKRGLSGAAPVARKPRGILFRLGHGWFDEDGFWCVADAKGNVTVTRGASKEMMRKLSGEQRRILERARLNARRNGLR